MELPSLFILLYLVLPGKQNMFLLLLDGTKLSGIFLSLLDLDYGIGKQRLQRKLLPEPITAYMLLLASS